MSKCLLLKSELKLFKEYLESREIVFKNGFGEIPLQVYIGTKWENVCKKHEYPDHLVIYDIYPELQTLVRQFNLEEPEQGIGVKWTEIDKMAWEIYKMECIDDPNVNENDVKAAYEKATLFQNYLKNRG